MARTARLVSATTDWTTVVPDADPDALAVSKLEGGQQVIEYAKAPKPKVRKGQTPPPDPAPIVVDPAQPPATDGACRAVDACRDGRAGGQPARPATLPPAGRHRQRRVGSGSQVGGHLVDRLRGHARAAPPKATKKSPHPDDPRTDAQKAGYESARSYDAWLTGVSKSTTTAALGDRLFLDIAGRGRDRRDQPLRPATTRCT